MLIPTSSDRTQRAVPFAVIGLVLLQFVILGIALANSQSQRAIHTLQTLMTLSIIPGDLRWWAPLTYSFIHLTPFHLSLNMLFLWVAGAGVEEVLGWKRFLALYLAAAVVSGLVEALISRYMPGGSKMEPIVGASGATAAIVGFFAVRFYRSRLSVLGIPWRISAVGLLAMALGSEMAAATLSLLQRGGPSGGVAANWAHIAGFLFGMVIAQVSRQVKAGRADYQVDDAVAELERGNPLSAVKRWQALCDREPTNLDAKLRLAKSWSLAGDRSQAASVYGVAIQGLVQAGRRSEAGTAYREATGLGCELDLAPSILFSIAGALEEAGDEVSALAVYQHVLVDVVDPNESAMALIRSAKLRVRLQMYPQAIEDIDRFLTEYPNHELRSFAEGLKGSIPPGQAN